MNPPWREYAEIPFGSLGWRMGAGEGYLDIFVTWMHQQEKEAISQYFARNVPPAEWREFIEYHLELIKHDQG